MSALLFKEKQRYDALPDKSKFVLFDDIVNIGQQWSTIVNKDKIEQFCKDFDDLVTNKLVQLYDDLIRSKQDGNLNQLGKKEEISPEHVEIAIIPLEYDEKSDAASAVEAAAVNDDAAAVNDNVVEAVEAVELEPLADHLPIINSENDSQDVLDVKVAFSDKSMEKVLDPKLDFARPLEVYNSTLGRLGRSCMELGIALGDLMTDVPEVGIIV